MIRICQLCLGLCAKRESDLQESTRRSDLQEFEWPTDRSFYDLQFQVGKGANATVWRAVCLSNDQPVAIKIMDLNHISGSFDDICQEVHTMRLADNPNVLYCHCPFICDDQLWLVMKFMDKGSCFDAMKSDCDRGRDLGMNEEWICYILHQTLLGLKYFHSQGQLHRNIKAGKILLTADGEVRLADGAVGWMIKNGGCLDTGDTVQGGGAGEIGGTFVGTPCWMAPEVMEHGSYNEKADIWSLGITALELAKGYAPYAHYTPMKVLLMTIKNEPPSLKSYENDRQPNGEVFSPSFKDFVNLCLQKDPKRRPSCQKLLTSKFFKNVRGRTSFVERYLVNVSDVCEGKLMNKNEFEETERPFDTFAKDFQA